MSHSKFFFHYVVFLGNLKSTSDIKFLPEVDCDCIEQTKRLVNNSPGSFIGPGAKPRVPSPSVSLASQQASFLQEGSSHNPPLIGPCQLQVPVCPKPTYPLRPQMIFDTQTDCTEWTKRKAVPTPLIRLSNLQIILHPQIHPPRPHPSDLRGSLTHRLQLHGVEQVVGEQFPSWKDQNLGPRHQGKTPCPSPTCLIFTSRSADKTAPILPPSIISCNIQFPLHPPKHPSPATAENL